MLLPYFFVLEKLTCIIFKVESSHGKSSVDVTATTKNHSEFISELLVGHTLSGCDTVVCLFGIGKGTIIKVLKRGYKIADVIEEAILFVATCYGSQARQDMSAVRFAVWSSKMDNKNLNSADRFKITATGY